MPGPLEGIRIIDLTTMLSGPWATMILADQGAEVIKVEVPGKGDHVRSLGNRAGGMSAMFLNINRNKKSITIDLKKPEGIELLTRLIDGAACVVQNFRPGVVQRLGIGPEAMLERNPSLVYVSISGFGDVGPWVHKRVYDPVIQALSGLTTVQAGSDEQRPRLIRTILPDKLSAVTAAQAIAAALVARERSGTGQHVRLSMLDAVLSFLWASDMGAQTYPDRPVSNQAAASFIDLIYQTRDGYMTVAVMSDKEWVGLCRAVERPDWLEDPRFSSPSARDQHVNERLEMTQSVLVERTTAEWMRRFEEHDVPCAPALTRSEVLEHPQVVASESIVETTHPVAGRLRQARTAARFAATPAEIRSGAPRLGEHNMDVLRELGLAPGTIDELRKRGVVGPEAYARPDEPCWSGTDH